MGRRGRGGREAVFRRGEAEERAQIGHLLRKRGVALHLQGVALDAHGGAQFQFLAGSGAAVGVGVAVLDEPVHGFFGSMGAGGFFGGEGLGFAAEGGGGAGVDGAFAGVAGADGVFRVDWSAGGVGRVVEFCCV